MHVIVRYDRCVAHGRKETHDGGNAVYLLEFFSRFYGELLVEVVLNARVERIRVSVRAFSALVFKLSKIVTRTLW